MEWMRVAMKCGRNGQLRVRRMAAYLSSRETPRRWKVGGRGGAGQPALIGRRLRLTKGHVAAGVVTVERHYYECGRVPTEKASPPQAIVKCIQASLSSVLNATTSTYPPIYP